jgi:hypothetical protein
VKVSATKNPQRFRNLCASCRNKSYWNAAGAIVVFDVNAQKLDSTADGAGFAATGGA